jgi:hypothetical protein
VTFRTCPPFATVFCVGSLKLTSTGKFVCVLGSRVALLVMVSVRWYENAPQAREASAR